MGLVIGESTEDLPRSFSTRRCEQSFLPRKDAPRREIIPTNNLVPFREKAVAKIATNKSRRTCDKDLHLDGACHYSYAHIGVQQWQEGWEECFLFNYEKLSNLF